MKRIAMATIVALAVPATLLMPVAAHASTEKCDPNSGSYSGACYTMSTYVKHVTVVQTVPLQNTSKITIKAHCSFTDTITESLHASASVTASAKATIFGAVEVGVSETVSLSVSQTASAATSAGGSFTLKPGQTVTCERIYSNVTTSVVESDYAGSKITTKKYTVTVPSSLGVRFA